MLITLSIRRRSFAVRISLHKKGIDDASLQALDFPALCARETTLASRGRGRVLDVGCATGRHSFELARDFEEVIGFDFSSAFVQACNKMKTNGRADYKAIKEVTAFSPPMPALHRLNFRQLSGACHFCLLLCSVPRKMPMSRVFLLSLHLCCCSQGTIMETRTAFVPAGIDVSRCKFVVGDACNMFDIKLPGGQPLGEFVCRPESVPPCCALSSACKLRLHVPP